MTDYHGQPVLKEPVWTWEIPSYFFTGGLGGASAGLAYLAERRGNQILARRTWATALFGVGVSPALLISDLGKPKRFINMLRMFKVTSPMSVGSWILSASGSATALAAADAWTGRFPRTGRLARPAAALLGLPLSTYTAALLANTAVPAWHEARSTLPFVFASGAALSAGAAGVIATPTCHAKPARRLALGSAQIEAGLTVLMEKRLGEAGKSYKEGPARKLNYLSRGCLAAGSALLQWRGAVSRPAAVAGGALLCAGALSARWSVFRAGVQSAADPAQVIEPQRAGITRGERRGGARRTSRVSAPEAALGSPATSRQPATSQ